MPRRDSFCDGGAECPRAQPIADVPRESDEGPGHDQLVLADCRGYAAATWPMTALATVTVL